jgi:hypothetical protein
MFKCEIYGKLIVAVLVHRIHAHLNSLFGTGHTGNSALISFISDSKDVPLPSSPNS